MGQVGTFPVELPCWDFWSWCFCMGYCLDQNRPTTGKTSSQYAACHVIIPLPSSPGPPPHSEFLDSDPGPPPGSGRRASGTGISLALLSWPMSSSLWSALAKVCSSVSLAQPSPGPGTQRYRKVIGPQAPLPRAGNRVWPLPSPGPADPLALTGYGYIVIAVIMCNICNIM